MRKLLGLIVTIAGFAGLIWLTVTVWNWALLLDKATLVNLDLGPPIRYYLLGKLLAGVFELAKKLMED